MNKSADATNSKQKLTVVAYKGKLLLICRDEISTNPTNPVWGFLSIKNVNDLFIKKVEFQRLGSDIDLVTLKDEQVNQLLRKEGWRFEFYKISELSKLNLTEDTNSTLSNYQEKITDLLAE